MARVEESSVPISVFWDIQNCPVPGGLKGYEVVSNLRNFLKSLPNPGPILKIDAFTNISKLKPNLRLELEGSGVNLHDVASPKPGSADVALLVEIIKFVLDFKPPHHIVLITGDGDFSNALNTLRFRGYEVILIHSVSSSLILKKSASVCVDWVSLNVKKKGIHLDSLPLEEQEHLKKKYLLPAIDEILSKSESVPSNELVFQLKEKLGEKKIEDILGKKASRKVTKLLKQKPDNYEVRVENGIPIFSLKHSEEMSDSFYQKTLDTEQELSSPENFQTQSNGSLFEESRFFQHPFDQLNALSERRFQYIDETLEEEEGNPSIELNGLQLVEGTEKQPSFLDFDFDISKFSKFSLSDLSIHEEPLSLPPPSRTKEDEPLSFEQIELNPKSNTECQEEKQEQEQEGQIALDLVQHQNGSQENIEPMKENSNENGIKVIPLSHSNSPSKTSLSNSPEDSNLQLDMVLTEIDSFLELKPEKKAHIGTISGHFVNKSMIPIIRNLGGVKYVVENSGKFHIQKDEKNGLWVAKSCDNIPMKKPPTPVPVKVKPTKTLDNVFTEVDKLIHQSSGKKVQIGAVSSCLTRKNLHTLVKSKGGVKKVLKDSGRYSMEMDKKNGLWVSSSKNLLSSMPNSPRKGVSVEALQMELDQLFDQNPKKKVQIGSISECLNRKGLLDSVRKQGGVKTFLEATGKYTFEKDTKNGLWVRKRAL